ncbi:MAG: hypothetical protein Q4G47_07665, partial [Lachnospiraceae bacterium]|nr:hypothetical protein [Lachnospiraceae bacterium]
VTQPAEQAEVKVSAQGGETETSSTTTQVIMDEDTRKSVSILRYYVNAVNYMSDFGELPEKLGIEQEYLREVCWGTVENEAVISGSIQAVYTDEESAKAIIEHAVTAMRNARGKATSLYGKHRLTIEPVIFRT